MLRLIARRAVAQLPLLLAVTLVVIVGSTLLGVCALLLTMSQEQALERGMAAATPAQVGVTAYAAEIPAADAVRVAADTDDVLRSALAPFPTTTTTRANSVMRELGPQAGGRHWAYLAGVDGLTARGRLTQGRWPGPTTRPAPREAVVLEPTARALGLTPGRTVRLGPEVFPNHGGSLEVLVVGVFQPLRDGGWDADTLAAAGYDPAYLDGRYPQPATVAGPFVVDQSELFDSGSAISSLRVTAGPDLAGSDGDVLGAATGRVAAADARLAGVLGDRAASVRVASDLPLTLATARALQSATRSTVLVVVLLGTVLAAVALGLAGRLVVGLRTDETALLSTLGAGRAQLVPAAALEAVLMAAFAAAPSVPLSSLVHAELTRLPALAGTGLAAGPRVVGAQVLAVVVGALVLALLLVVPVLRPDPGQVSRERRRVDVLARSGTDLALLAVAAVGWWQLRAQPPAPAGVDVVRVLAPALCLIAGAALALRLVTLPLRPADRWAVGSRGLVVPLAVLEAARRPRAVAAGLLVTMAAAAASFALAFNGTWQQSQKDQAAGRVGTDLTLTLSAPARVGQDAAVAAATGGTVSPVTDRGVAIGQFLGGAGDPPHLVAVDAARAAALLRGRPPDGRTWTQVGGALAPAGAVAALPLPRSPSVPVTLTGTADPPAPLTVRARMLVQGPGGLRTPCAAGRLRLDGRPHRLPRCGGPEASVVALSLEVAIDPADPTPAPQSSRLDVSLGVPGTGAGVTGGSWSAGAPRGSPGIVQPAAQVSGTASGGTASEGTVVRTTATVHPAGLTQRSRTLVTTAFAEPAAVPVALSRRLADLLGATTGARLSVSLDQTVVPIVVRGIVPEVPSAPGEAAVLADADTLSRALISAGTLDPAVDAFWVGGPTRPGAAPAAAALRLGPVVTRASLARELARGPLRAGLPVALALLVPAALLLALTGTVMNVVSDLETRALEVSRLRGLGVSRRDVLGGLLLQHGSLLALLMLAGAGVGALASWALSPSLVRSDLGAAPLPTAVPQWPWAVEIGLIGGLLVVSVVAVAVVIAAQVRRADAAHLRVGP